MTTLIHEPLYHVDSKLKTPPPAVQADTALDTSRYQEVLCQCSYPFSMWSEIGTFHICTGFSLEKIYIDCSTAVDCVVIICTGIRSFSMTATDSVGTAHKNTVEVVQKDEDIQRVDIPLPWPTKKILMVIQERSVMFPCVYKITASSAIRSSSLSTPIRGSPEESWENRPHHQLHQGAQQHQPLIMKGYRPSSSGGDRAYKAAVHGAAAISRVTSTEKGPL